MTSAVRAPSPRSGSLSSQRAGETYRPRGLTHPSQSSRSERPWVLAPPCAPPLQMAPGSVPFPPAAHCLGPPERRERILGPGTRGPSASTPLPNAQRLGIWEGKLWCFIAPSPTRPALLDRDPTEPALPAPPGASPAIRAEERPPRLPPPPRPKLSGLSTYGLPAAGVMLRARAERRWWPRGREVGSVGGAELGSAGSL